MRDLLVAAGCAFPAVLAFLVAARREVERERRNARFWRGKFRRERELRFTAETRVESE